MKKTISFLMLSFMMSAHAEIKGCGDIHGPDFYFQGLTQNHYVTIKLAENGMINGQMIEGSTPTFSESKPAEVVSILMKEFSELPRRIKADQELKVKSIQHDWAGLGNTRITLSPSSSIKSLSFSGSVDEIQASKKITITCTPKPVVDVVELLKKDLKNCAQDA